MNRSRTLALILAAIPFAPLLPANALPDCDAWLANRAPLVSEFRLPSVDLEPLKAAGVSIEPTRRLRAKDYPWAHDVQIALPPSYGKSDRRYPVLWVMDGQFLFKLAVGVVTSCAPQHMPEMIVVGVGATSDADWPANEIQARRTFDFSPNTIKGFNGFGSKQHNERQEASEKRLKAEGKFTSERMGGAPRFLSFVVDDVRRQLAQDYRMADDHTLFGHSGGGLFCGYALVARPSGFNRYVCGSPPLAAGDFEVFRMEERYAQQNKDMAAAVVFGAGEKELLQGGTWGLVSSMVRMAELLKMRAYPSLKLYERIFTGEDHVSVMPPLLAWGLQTVWQTDMAAPAPTGSSKEARSAASH